MTTVEQPNLGFPVGKGPDSLENKIQLRTCFLCQKPMEGTKCMTRTAAAGAALPFLPVCVAYLSVQTMVRTAASVWEF